MQINTNELHIKTTENAYTNNNNTISTEHHTNNNLTNYSNNETYSHHHEQPIKALTQMNKSLTKIIETIKEKINKTNIKNTINNINLANIDSEEEEYNNKQHNKISDNQSDINISQLSASKEEIEFLNQTPVFGDHHHHDQENSEPPNQQQLQEHNSEELQEEQQHEEQEEEQEQEQSHEEEQQNETEENSPNTEIQHSFNEENTFKNIKENENKNSNTSIINESEESPEKVEPSNEFIAEFPSHEKLEEVQKYVANLKSETIEKILSNEEANHHHAHILTSKLSLINANIQNQMIKLSFDILKREGLATPNKSSQISSDKKNEGGISNRMSSAESQRIKSGFSKKSSENDESFNLDLTIKTKNSKNSFRLNKIDSLLYSAESGFGFNPSSPDKNSQFNHRNLSKTPNKVEEKLKVNNFHKSYSENIDLQLVNHEINENKKVKKLQSSNENIEEFHENSYEELYESAKFNNIEEKINKEEEEEEEEENKEEELEEEEEEKLFNYLNSNKETNKEEQIEDIFNDHRNQNLLIPEQQNNNIHSFDSATTPIKNNSIEDIELHENTSSAKSETIIDKAENFYADDEEIHEQSSENQHQNKKSGEYMRQRVETDMLKAKKDHSKYKKLNKNGLSNVEKINRNNSHSNSRVNSQKNLQSGVFQTEISHYQNKISRIKEEKEEKKRKLENELAKVKQEIKVLNEKSNDGSPNSKNNYISRVKISDNTEAKKQALSLVKNLRSQKRNRNIAKIEGFQNLDKNINGYMEELMKLRSQNEEKTKQKRKLEVLERMKNNEIRKMSDRKKVESNQQFLINLKASSGGTGGLKSDHHPQPESKRSPIKEEETEHKQEFLTPSQIKDMTPELNQKKAYLNRLRGLSARKGNKEAKKDLYEQVLS